MADELSLSAEFPRADEQLWREIATKALDGAAPESLNTRTQHGVTVKALYSEADWPSASNPSGAPGAAPFTRGSAAERDPYLPWDIRQEASSPRPADAAREVVHGKLVQRGGEGGVIAVDARGNVAMEFNSCRGIASSGPVPCGASRVLGCFRGCSH